MPFNSFEFWAFFCVVYALYRMLPRAPQNALLLLASYAFYAAWDWRFLSLLWLSTGVDYCVGRALGATDALGRRRALLCISIATNLGILGFFKYAGFFVESFGDLLSVLGLHADPFTLGIILPVGISFYTFQTLSYTIDVYQRSLAPTRNLLDFALFVAFFPQLVAGPIERAANMLPQFAQRRFVSPAQLQSGLWLCVWGLYKKVVIADNLAQVVDAVYRPGAEPNGAEVAVATIAFAFQVYCDFSGYTDIARGTARLLGFDLSRNFDVPFAATDPGDFWRRWHISLSTWLRDYVFVPVTRGLLRSRLRGEEGIVLFGLFGTMTLCGLWHGAAWTFVAFGAYHGLWLCLHRASFLVLPRLDLPAPARLVWTACKLLVTFLLVCFGFLIFRAESLGHAAALASTLGAGIDAASVAPWLLPFFVLVGPLVVMQIAQLRSGDPEVVLRVPGPLRAGVYAAALGAIALLGEHGGQPFIYFQF